MKDLNETLTSSRDWAPLFAAFAEVLEWLLDRARDFAREYPQEVAAVERVRTFVRRRIAGDPAHARVDDLLFTLGLIAGALEQQRQSQRIANARGSGVLPMSKPASRLPLRRAQLAGMPPSRNRRPM